MKVAELREKLSKLKKEDVIKIASEFYKLIPKAKKEDYKLDDYINNPTVKKKKVESFISLDELEFDINEFVINAKEQYYLIPNSVISKKERPKWRFKVKNWYKELTNKRRKDKNLEKQTELLIKLYELLCEACAYIYFSGENPFRSVGIEQIDFFKIIVNLVQEDNGKADTIKKLTDLIVNNYVDRETLYSELMEVLFDTFDNTGLKYRGIEVVEKNIKFATEDLIVNKVKPFSTERYYKIRKINNLTEMGLHLYLGLYEIDAGIKFYNKYYKEQSDEVKLYILVSILMTYNETKKIEELLKNALKNKIELRKSLLNCLSHIENTGELPNYL